KKKLGSTVEERKRLIEPENEEISVSRQCELLGISRSVFYYKAIGESAYNLQLMNLIDEYYTGYPFYGVRRLTAWLRKEGHEVNPKRVKRLMRKMGLYAIYPKPWLSKGGEGHKKYPYLLRGLSIEYPDHVWCADITYIRLNQGYVYLMAIMDWYSRYVLSWETSITLDVGFCLEALDRAIRKGCPEIFNTDQGSQFTSNAFTGKLEGAGVKISMDGRGRVFDNIFIERLWRSIKYEEVYLKDYKTVREAVDGLRRYFDFYNNERLHQSLEYRAPATLYCSNKKARKGEMVNTLELTG
ncbi:MAG: transposase, partial [Candidatus Brocadia sinica]